MTIYRRSQTYSSNTLIRQPGITLSFAQTPPATLYPPQIDTSKAFAIKFIFSKPAVEYDTGLHFHADKAEALRVEKGAISVQLGNDILVVTPETGEVIVPRWTAHRWWLHPSDEETIVWERTLPGSREKEVFFRTLISYLGDLPPNSPPAFFQMYRIFAQWDNFPVLATWCARGPGSRMVVAWTYAMGMVGGLLGYKATYEEYVPGELHDMLRYVVPSTSCCVTRILTCIYSGLSLYFPECNSVRSIQSEIARHTYCTGLIA